MVIANNIKKIKSEIGNARLVVVTKTRTIEEIKEVLDAGIKDLGENRIQEALEKYSNLDKEKYGYKLHMVGHLQTNKVKKAVELFDMIQSVDSLKLAKEIDKRCKQQNKKMSILVEVNIAGEEQKHGIKPEEVFPFLGMLVQFDNIELKGLMAMAPFVEQEEKTRPYFRKMKEIFDKTKLEILSMGMTNDYKVAVDEGSNMVRIGTAIFKH